MSLSNDLQVAVEVICGQELKVIYPGQIIQVAEDGVGVRVRLREQRDISHWLSASDLDASWMEFRLRASTWIVKEQQAVIAESSHKAKHEAQVTAKTATDRQRTLSRNLAVAVLLLTAGVATILFLDQIWLPVVAALLMLTACVVGLSFPLRYSSMSCDCFCWSFTCVVQKTALVSLVCSYILRGSEHKSCRCYYFPRGMIQSTGLLALAASGVSCIRCLWGSCIGWFTITVAILAICQLSVALWIFWQSWLRNRIRVNGRWQYRASYIGEVSQLRRGQSITFRGSVLPGRGKKCVCSWPGKYESAWDNLVCAATNGDVSAAVVFLPQGCHLFGLHDTIPAFEHLQGECWCIPLYGEKKAWGCRWWTEWTANIEKAVKYGARLQVYYFEGMVGRGKVQSFATAGQEHVRREELWTQMKEFERSQAYQDARDAGLDLLSHDLRTDGSSQYSREKARLFLAQLPQPESRQFLEESEGLGNSQKAEVAWLEKKGYVYEEVDVSKWLEPPVPRVSEELELQML
ncbi:unnamed protein product [Symbiodinium sp. CCMP2592]|nr:unnamed protein product [Symbiodinium sp. CCMP2592]